MVSRLWLSLVLNLTNRLCIGISSTERYSSEPTYKEEEMEEEEEEEEEEEGDGDVKGDDDKHKMI